MAPDAEKQANKTTMGLQGQQTDPAVQCNVVASEETEPTHLAAVRP